MITRELALAIYHAFPEAVVKEGLFKERLTALVAYMKCVDHASYSTIRKFIRDVLGESVSRGYLRKIVAKASAALDAPYAELLERLPREQVLNVDETGHKENGGKFWTWLFRADLYVLFKIDKSCGSKVLVDVLGEAFDGLLGCDYFSAYYKCMKDLNVTVQFCIAHLIRDIKYLAGLKDRGRHLRPAGPMRIRVHPRRRARLLSKPTRPIPVTRLGLIGPAPTADGMPGWSSFQCHPAPYTRHPTRKMNPPEMRSC